MNTRITFEGQAARNLAMAARLASFRLEHDGDAADELATLLAVVERQLAATFGINDHPSAGASFSPADSGRALRSVRTDAAPPGETVERTACAPVGPPASIAAVAEEVRA